MKTTKKILGTLFLSAVLPAPLLAGTTLINSTGSSDETLMAILLMMAAFQLAAIAVVAGVIKSVASNAKLWDAHLRNKAGAIGLVLILTSADAMAQSVSYENLVTMDDTGFLALIALNLVLIATFIYLTGRLNGLIRLMMKDEEGRAPQTFLDKMGAMLTDAIPLEREKEVETDHVYDGIRELDNNLPPWWLWGFYFTIAFSVVYVINYHFGGGGATQLQEYQTEIESAEAAKAVYAAAAGSSVDEANVEYLSDATSLDAGKKIFVLYCAPCHAEHGGSAPGGVGPNLTDDYWIHGGSMNDIYRIIKVGVPAKGMVSWEAQLSPSKIQQVASYIKSLYGTNPPDAKEPQGDLWKAEVAETTPATDARAE